MIASEKKQSAVKKLKKAFVVTIRISKAQILKKTNNHYRKFSSKISSKVSSRNNYCMLQLQESLLHNKRVLLKWFVISSKEKCNPKKVKWTLHRESAIIERILNLEKLCLTSMVKFLKQEPQQVKLLLLDKEL